MALLLSGGVRADETRSADQALSENLSFDRTERTERDPELGHESALDSDSSYHPRVLSLIPLERRADLRELIAAHTPGSDRDEDTGALSLYGAARGHLAVYLDGILFRRLRLPTAMLASARIEPAGYGTEYADAAAAVVSLQARAGTNRFRFEYETFGDLQQGSSLTTSLGFSAPLVRDRVFVAAGAEGYLVNGQGARDPTGFFPNTPDPTGRQLAAALNTTFLPTAGQRIDLLGVFKGDSVENFDGLGVAPEAQPRILDRGYLVAARWRGTLWQGATAGLRAGFSSNTERLDSILCWQNPDTCETEVPKLQLFPRRQLFDNGLERERDTARVWQLGGRMAHALGAKAEGRGELRAFARLYGLAVENDRSIPSGSYAQYNGLVPDRSITHLEQAPGTVDSLGFLMGVEADVRLVGGLWVVPGLAWVAGRTESGMGSTWSATSLAPRLALAWDATGDGRTWLRASAGQRADADLFRLQREVLGSPVRRTCQWDQASNTYTRNCTVSGNRTVTLGLPCGPTGINDGAEPCRGQATVSDTLELTAGARHRITPLVELGMNLVYRDGEALAPLETNRVWVTSGGGLMPTGSFRNGRAESVIDLSTNLQATTLGLSPGVRLRGSHVDLGASYTWLRRRPVGTSRPGARWQLPEDRHRLNILGSFTPAPYASFGLAFRYASGAPYRRFFYDGVTGSFEDYRARVGINPGTNLNDPSDDSPSRLPSVHRLSLHLRLHGRELLGVDVDFYTDLLNILAAPSNPGDEDGGSFSESTATAVVGDAFETTTTGRRFVRVGIRYRY